MINKESKQTVYEPLFQIHRGGTKELEPFGSILIFNGDKHLYGPPHNADAKIVSRSLLKPWQMLATKVPIYQDHQWLLSSASHSGQAIHMQVLESLIERYRLDKDQLLCPEAYPTDKKLAAAAEQDEKPPHTLWHNCSGKHLAYLWACGNEGFDPLTYNQSDHPINQRLKSIIEQKSKGPIDFIQDGCTLQSAILTQRQMIQLFQSLFIEKSEKTTEAFLAHWITHPRLLSGINRLDADITEDLGGKWIAKEGADGLIILQTIGCEENFTILTKLSSGSCPRFWSFAIWSALKNLDHPHEAMAHLKHYLALKVQNYLEPAQEFKVIAPPSLV